MDTTPDVKDEKKEEKKKAGFLANLVGKPAANGPLAIGGLGTGGGGASGGLASLFAGTPFASLFTSGILATKAGLIAAALVATAVLGSLGYVGYKFFGAGGSDKAGTGYSLFAPRPAEEQKAIEAERAAEDGRSASLDAFAKANAGAAGDGAQASDAQAGEASGGVVKDAAAPAASASPNLQKNSGDVSGNKAAKLGAGKFGQMSKLSLGGGAGNLGGGGSSASTSLAPAGLQAGKGGKLAPMSSKAGAAAPTRGLARKLGGNGAMAQLKGVRGDQRGATSSMAAGSTYDGGPRMPIAPSATPAAAPDLPVSDKSGTPNPAGMVTDNFPDPPQPSAAGWACPWENAMRIASMAIMAGVALLFVAGKLMSNPADVTGMTKVLAYTLAGMAALAGALAVKMGTMISQPPYGQQLQGGMFTAAGACLMASSGLMMATFAQGTDPSALLQILMVVSGAAALGMLAVAKLSEPKKYPSWKFEDGQAPDYNHKATDRDGRTAGGQGIFG